MAEKKNGHLLADVLERGHPPVHLIEEATKNRYTEPLARLILASEEVAQRKQQAWEFKSLAAFGEEKFATGQVFVWDGEDRGWIEGAIRQFSRCITDLIQFEPEGLLLYVQDGSGGYRLARRGDEAYDFICRLREEGSESDLRFCASPRWAQELFIFRPNYEVYCLMWHDYSSLADDRYEASKALKRTAVIAETRRRSGEAESQSRAGIMAEQEEQQDDFELARDLHYYRKSVARAVSHWETGGVNADLLKHRDALNALDDLWLQMADIAGITTKQAADLVELHFKKHSLALYVEEERTGLWYPVDDGGPAARESQFQLLVDVWNTAESLRWNRARLAECCFPRLSSVDADLLLRVAHDIRAGTSAAVEAEAPTTDADDPRWPEELGIAWTAWRAARNNAEREDKRPGAYIREWLSKHYPDLSDEARKRIATVANWDKSPGRR